MEDDTFDPNVQTEPDEPRIQSQHQYEQNFSIYDILSVEQFHEELEYKTYCWKSSSWLIEIRLEKQIPFNNFNMFVTLKRIDMGELNVEGILRIWFLNAEGKKCPISYSIQSIMDGKGAFYEVFAVDDHFKCLLRDSDYVTLPDDVLIVKVQLYVRFCCEIRLLACPRL